MFRDRFLGGPLDGEERDTAPETIGSDRVRDRDSGTEYVRAPEHDTPEARAWKVDDRPAGDHGPVYAQSKSGLTLGELRGFIATADQAGWPDDAVPRSVAGWRMRLHKIELSDRSFQGNPSRD